MDHIEEKRQQLNHYLKLLEQDSNNLELLLSICNCYRLLGDFNSALFYLEAAKAIDADACLAMQGFITLNQGHYEQAKEILSRALLCEDFPFLRYCLAICHYSLGEAAAGVAVLNPVLTEGESIYDAELLMARLLYSQGCFNEAITLLKNIIKQHGADEEAFTLLTQAYFDNYELALAEETAQQTLTLNPNNHEVQIILILLQLIDNNVPVETIKNLLNQTPKDHRLWFALGTIHFRELNLESAEQTFLKSVELNSNFYDGWISLGWCQLFLDKLNEAHHSYHQATAVNEENAEGWGGLALASALRKELSTTNQLISKAKELDPNCFLADIAQLISLNQTSSSKNANMYFDQTPPSIRDQIRTAMASLLQEMETNITIH